MTTTASEQSPLLSQLKQTVTPEDPINIGYLLYRSERLRQSCGLKKQESAAADHALLLRVLAQLAAREKEFASFRSDPTGARVVNAIWEAAVSYCDGLMRAEKAFQDTSTMAEERKETVKQNKLMTTSVAGFVKGGVKIALVGITVFSAAFTLLHLDASYIERVQSGGTPAFIPALALATFGSLVTAWFQITYISIIEDELFLEYRLSVLEAQVRRERHRRQELIFAWEMFCRDHERYLNCKPDKLDSLELLLLPGDERSREYEAELFALTNQLEKTPFGRLLYGFGVVSRRKPKNGNQNWVM